MRLPLAIKRLVAQRAGFCCEYCLSQEAYSTERFSVEHIIPRAAGGTDNPENLAMSCQGCNNRKAIAVECLDPLTLLWVPLYGPRRHRWDEHFAWIEESVFVVGLTPTGRATVDRLQLNRLGVVNLRQVLRLAGKHPRVAWPSCQLRRAPLFFPEPP